MFTVRNALAPVFGLDPERIRVIAPYVGGGFGTRIRNLPITADKLLR